MLENNRKHVAQDLKDIILKSIKLIYCIGVF